MAYTMDSDLYSIDYIYMIYIDLDLDLDSMILKYLTHFIIIIIIYPMSLNIITFYYTSL